MTQEHTLREKGQALFLSALMVLSVFAMSAAFAGAAAAEVQDVSVDNVNLADGGEATIEVTHAETDTNVYAVIDVNGNDQYDTDTDILVSETATSGESTTLTQNVSGLDGEYSVYAFSGTDENVVPDDGAAISSTVSDSFTVSDSAGDSEDGDESQPDASLDADQYSEEAGDIAEFTVDMTDTDGDAILTIEDENGDYWADLHIDAGDQDEVTVYFNTYNAGQEGATFSTESDATTVTAIDEQSIETGQLNTGSYDLNLYLTDQEASSFPEGERVDTDTLTEENWNNWADAAVLELSEGSIGDVTPGVAPGDTDLDDVTNETTENNEVAEGDYFVVGVEASGIFGYLEDNDYDDQISFEMEQTNPGIYESPDRITAEDDDFEIVENPESDQVFFILDTSDIDTEAGAEYDVNFSVSENYGYADEDAESTTSFSVVERSVEVTGDFDDDDNLQVEQGEENSTITGESSLAPGSDVQVRLYLGALDPGMESQTVEVQDDGTIEADFDLSDREIGEEFAVEIVDSTNDDVNDRVSAVLVESTDDQEPHPVTITVEDADGNAVSGADVTVDGETQTTDDNGEATFELAHGEYDVSASHDGQEATGTLTVGDDTEDSTTIVLGEEDQDLNENAGSDDDEQNQDDNTQDDNNQDDQNNDDNNQDDSSGDANGDDSSGDDPEDEEQPGFGIAVALIALLAAAGIALRNRA